GEQRARQGQGQQAQRARTKCGRRLGAQRNCVSHESLKPGEICPVCKKGKVYELREPAVIVRITAAAPLEADIYEMQRLRCNLCGEVFTARAPPDAEKPKYDETAAAMIALLRYGAGLPHYRLGKLQRSLGIPLPPSTQWLVVSRAAPSIAPVYEELIRLAAQGELFHNDDTPMPVLALTGKRRAREAPDDDPADRTGMFTTGIVSRVEGRRIALFFTSRQHAGENLESVLKRRASELEPPLQMCDGLARNLPRALATILANCLSHARRHFVDVTDNFPDECRFVLETLAEVFRNDAHCRKQRMSPAQRLAYHQEHSGPVMDKLKAWFDAQFDERKVEPNSGLGQAFTYMLKRWDAFTLFLRKPGAPIDNNVCERVLKRAIMHRNNSRFYRSLRGARVGDMFMSLIHTAELCGADPFDYLVAVLRHADAVRDAPAEWVPWSYVEARARLAVEQAA
ncbi:MAG: IS66 family transposase, partial [Steroidobacteraceae bacterium]